MIELSISVVVLLVLTVMAGPSFSVFIKDNRLSTQVSALASGLQFARSEAIKPGARVSLCKSVNQASCNAGETASWRDGWLVFVDDGATIGSLDAGEELLRVVRAAPAGIAISVDNFGNWVSYLPSGGSSGSSGLAQGQFLFCDDRGDDHARKIAVSMSGRVSAQASVGSGEC